MEKCREKEAPEVTANLLQGSGLAGTFILGMRNAPPDARRAEFEIRVRIWKWSPAHADPDIVPCVEIRKHHVKKK